MHPTTTSQKRLRSSSEHDPDAPPAPRYPSRRRITGEKGPGSGSAPHSGAQEIDRDAGAGRPRRRDDLSSALRGVTISPQSKRGGAGSSSKVTSTPGSRGAREIGQRTGDTRSLGKPAKNQARDVYTPSADDLPETSLDTDLTLDTEEDLKPTFTLDDFTVFDPANGNEMVSLREIFSSNAVGMRGKAREFEAVGVVKPIEANGDEDGDGGDEDDDDETLLGDDEAGDGDGGRDEEGVNRKAGNRVRLGAIWKYEVAVGSADPSIWLLTSVAWYKLVYPSPKYRPYYENLWLRHRLAHLVAASAARSKRLQLQYTREEAYTSFVDSLRVTPTCSDEVVEAVPVLGREMCEADVLKFQDYIIRQMKRAFKSLCTSPLVRAVEDLPADDNSSDSDSSDALVSDPSSPSSLDSESDNATRAPRRRARGRGKQSGSGNRRARPKPRPSEADILKKPNLTFVTPYIRRIAGQLFQKTLFVAGQEGEESDEDSEAEVVADFMAVDEGEGSDGDDGADIAKVEWIGDEIERNQVDRHRSYYASVKVGDTVYNVGDVVMVQPGDDNDTARVKNASSLSSTSPNRLANTKWFARIIALFETDDDDGDDTYYFHAQWFVHGSKTILQEAASPGELFLTSECDDCLLRSIEGACNLRWLQAQDSEPRSAVGNDFFCRFQYTADDASFLNSDTAAPDGRSECACCVQRDILECSADPIPNPDGSGGFIFKGTTYHVGECVYSVGDSYSVFRIGQIVKYDATHVWRQLQPTNSKVKWPIHTLAGSKLRALDLYSGAGGLSQGLEESGFIKSLWAVEISPAACASFQENHPDAAVYNQCANVLLQHIVEGATGSHEQLHALGTGESLPPLPKPGDCNLIVAGPPCPDFSGLNRFKSADNPRKTLFANALSWVDHFRPKYFLAENVVGLLYEPLKGRKTTVDVDDKTQGSIKWGYHKFILRALTGMGYQVRWSILHCGAYGAPQTRHRVVYWAAQQGVELPGFPLPAHAIPVSQHNKFMNLNLPTYGKAKVLQQEDGCAALPPVTVRDAIGDLPGFHWQNREDPDLLEPPPHPADLDSYSADLAKESASGPPNGTAYPSPPLNQYQYWIRSGATGITYHQTRCFQKTMVKRVINIPERANADHRDLPPDLSYRSYVSAHGAAPRNGQYQSAFSRVSWDGAFPTIVTNIGPSHRQGRCLHPSSRFRSKEEYLLSGNAHAHKDSRTPTYSNR
ncbi:hypothetical protein BOTBODRAFT_143057 [Botryobasidium botryosum FD-172 SS1]|uniref:DNA (cytosine-5-)-methyltransferase n=1 Tax=Botryobasidium botryosum (strain FD-172 SS1) TaxID=930990 RepID=A0A067MXZ3_BOTB1|nr:hypothetical protein BOTBODRAFT_143057 [Botryobasidium botryosum FD-172 SS1]